MTGPENFIARWSRRKREAEEEAEAAKEPAAPSQPITSDPASATDEKEAGGRTTPASAAAPTEPAFDLSQLPSLESITAETDIRAFLAPGVPAELTRAALRRVWAADPKIRDFVGLAENAWDFNAPGAMAGFGSLEMTDDLRRLVSGMFGGGAPAAPAERPAATAAAQQIESSDESATAKAELAATAEKIAPPPQDDPADVADVSRPRDELPQPRQEYIAAQHNPEKDEVSQTIGRRPHGQALPK